jgi:NitT/TauT family transport system substrate-binding protein
MCFQDDLQRAGLDPAALAGRRVRPMKRNIAAYLRSEVDVVQVFEPYADQLVSEGQGSVWHRFTDRGDIAYTTFYATRKMTRYRRDDCRRLVTGMSRALADLQRSRADTVAAAVSEFLPDQPRERLVRIIAQYRQSGLWAHSTDLPPTPLLRLKAALVSGGLIRSDPAYGRLIDRELSALA